MDESQNNYAEWKMLDIKSTYFEISTSLKFYKCKLISSDQEQISNCLGVQGKGLEWGITKEHEGTLGGDEHVPLS